MTSFVLVVGQHANRVGEPVLGYAILAKIGFLTLRTMVLLTLEKRVQDVLLVVGLGI